MAILILGLAIFQGVHSVSIAAPAWRERVRARMGEGAWKGVYSLVSAAGLALIVWGYGLARADPFVLWVPPTGLRHLTLLLMIPAFVLLASAFLPGRIKAAVRHPMLTAVKVWALAHLLANGTLADLVLFGGFLAWAVADRISVKKRERAGLLAPPAEPPRGANDSIAVGVGLAAYAFFAFWLHSFLIGVPVLG